MLTPNLTRQQALDSGSSLTILLVSLAVVCSVCAFVICAWYLGYLDDDETAAKRQEQASANLDIAPAAILPEAPKEEAGAYGANGRGGAAGVGEARVMAKEVEKRDHEVVARIRSAKATAVQQEDFAGAAELKSKLAKAEKVQEKMYSLEKKKARAEAKDDQDAVVKLSRHITKLVMQLHDIESGQSPGKSTRKPRSGELARKDKSLVACYVAKTDLCYCRHDIPTAAATAAAISANANVWNQCCWLRRGWTVWSAAAAAAAAI